jgi:hypothetical protein
MPLKERLDPISGLNLRPSGDPKLVKSTSAIMMAIVSQHEFSCSSPGSAAAAGLGAGRMLKRE